MNIEDLAYEAWKAKTELEWGREYFDKAINFNSTWNNPIPKPKEDIRNYYRGFKAGFNAAKSQETKGEK